MQNAQYVCQRDCDVLANFEQSIVFKFTYCSCCEDSAGKFGKHYFKKS